MRCTQEEDRSYTRNMTYHVSYDVIKIGWHRIIQQRNIASYEDKVSIKALYQDRIPAVG